jgi:hypothetical protein
MINYNIQVYICQYILKNNFIKVVKNLIPISKQQMEYIKSKRKEIPIPHTCDGKPKGKRKKRSIEDTPDVQQLLKEYNEKYIKVIFDSEKQ